ncbi:TetR/AcrR family transcriptional regulator [Streptomyces sp. NPDC002402]
MPTGHVFIVDHGIATPHAWPAREHQNARTSVWRMAGRFGREWGLARARAQPLIPAPCTPLAEGWGELLFALNIRRVSSVCSTALPPQSTQIVGMVMNRYIWQVGDIATLPADTVTDLLAPTIQHYLADPLPTKAQRPLEAEPTGPVQ